MKRRRNKKKLLAILLLLMTLTVNCITENLIVTASSQKPVKITLNHKQAAMSEGETLKLKVKKVSPKGSSKSVEWKTSNKKVATVSASGKVKAKRSGKVTITAVSESNSKAVAKCKIRVYKATKKLAIKGEKSYTLSIGQSVTLKTTVKPSKGTQPVQWSSKNEKVAKVNSKGKMTAVSEGKTVISGKSGRKKVSVTVTVKADNSNNPNNPDNPDNPGNPDNPSNPDNSGNPDNPSNPDNPGNPDNPDTPSAESYSRAEWIGILADKMGYSILEEELPKDAETGDYLYSYDDILGNENAWKIESAFRNGVIPEEISDNDAVKVSFFEPEERVTREFAAVTAVRALGFVSDTPAVSSDSAKLRWPNEDGAALKASLMTLKDGAFCPDDPVTKEEVQGILTVIDEVLAGRTVSEEKVELEYQEEVVQGPEDYQIMKSEDGKQIAVILEESGETSGLQAGEILNLPANDVYTDGLPLKVESVQQLEDGKVEVCGNLPRDVFEVYKEVSLAGTGYIDEENIQLADGVSIVEEKEEASYARIDGTSETNFKKTFEITNKDVEAGGAEGSAKMELTLEIPRVEYVLDFDMLSVSEVLIKVPNTVTTTLDVEAKWEGKKEFAKLPIEIKAGFSINIVASLVAGVDGQVHLEYTVDNTFGAQYKEGSLSLIKENTYESAEIGMGATCYGGLNFRVELLWLRSLIDYPIYTAGIEVGISLHGETKNRKVKDGKKLICSDLGAGLYFDIFVGEEDNLLAAIVPELNQRWEIFPKDDLKVVIASCHFENGRKVARCTYKPNLVQIHVTGEDKKPLTGAEVTLLSDSEKRKCSTNGAGKTEISLETAKYDYYVKMNGYKKCKGSIDVKGDGITNLEINLVKTEADGEGSGELGFVKDTVEPAASVITSGREYTGEDVEDYRWVLDENYKFTVGGICRIEYPFGWGWAWTDGHNEISNLRDKIVTVDIRGFEVDKAELNSMFSGFKNLELVDARGWTASNVTNMSGMFSGCENTEKLEIKGLNTMGIENMSSMFDGCKNLKSLDLSAWKTKTVRNMSDMFAHCEKLESLDLRAWDTGNVETIENMFYLCKGLKSLNLNGWNTKNVKDMSYMFSGCGSLESLDLSGFEIGTDTDVSGMLQCRFNGICALKRLVTPAVSGQDIELPAVYRFPDGQERNYIPATDQGGYEITYVRDTL